MDESPKVPRPKVPRQSKVRPSRIKKILYRRLTPHKAKQHTVDTVPRKDPQQERDADLKEMIQALRNDLQLMKIDGNMLGETVQEVQRNVLNINKEMVTDGNLDRNLKMMMDTMASHLDNQKKEIDYNRQKMNDMEENIKDIQLEAETTKVIQLEHESKITELEETVVKDLNSFRKEMQGFEYRLSKVSPPTPFLPTTSQNAEKVQPQMRNPTNLSSMENKNIIIEGLYEFPFENVEERVGEVMNEIGTELLEAEYNKAERIGKQNQVRDWPRPIRVELMTAHKKSKILSRRENLQVSQDYYKVRINPDEPKGVRIGRAKLRQAAVKARNEGKRVKQTPDYVVIEGVRYDLETIEKFTQAMEGTPTENKTDNPTYPSRNKYAEDTCMLDTPAGMAFFTIRCRLSNFYPCSVRFDGRCYVSAEHAYQGEKAITAKAYDKLSDILKAPTAKEAKDIGNSIPYNPLWERIKVDRMRDILNAKYRQNKELGDYLCSFKGKNLIEASWDGFWGARAPLNSEEIKKGTWTGNNNLGKLLTEIKNDLLRERAVNTHSIKVPPLPTQRAETQPAGAVCHTPTTDLNTAATSTPNTITQNRFSVLEVPGTHSTRL